MSLLITSCRIPPNVQFEVEDAEDTWPERHPFDLIHCRYMPACISDFPKLLTQVYQYVCNSDISHCPLT